MKVTDFHSTFTESHHRNAKRQADRNRTPSVLEEEGLIKHTRRLAAEPLKIDELIMFRKLVRSWLRVYAMAEGRLKNEQYSAFYIEDVREGIKKGQGVIKWWDGTTSKGCGYRWYSELRPILQRLLSIFWASLTLVVIAVQVKTLLVTMKIVDAVSIKIFTSGWQPLVIAGCTYITLGYAFFILTWATKRLMAGRGNLLVRGRNTSALSLSYYAQFSISVSAPLAYYTLQFLFPRMQAGETSGPGVKTAFYEAYGSKVQAFGATSVFSLVVPVILTLFVLLQVCGIYNRMLRVTGLSWLSFDTDIKVSDGTHSDISLGKKILMDRRTVIEDAIKYKAQKENRKRSLFVSSSSHAVDAGNGNSVTEVAAKVNEEESRSGWGVVFNRTFNAWTDGSFREPLISNLDCEKNDEEAMLESEDEEIAKMANEVWDTHARQISEDDRQYQDTVTAVEGDRKREYTFIPEEDDFAKSHNIQSREEESEGQKQQKDPSLPDWVEDSTKAKEKIEQKGICPKEDSRTVMGESSGAVDDLMKLVGSSETPGPMAEASRGHQILEGLELHSWVEKFTSSGRSGLWRRRWFVFNKSTGNLEYYRYTGKEKKAKLLQKDGQVPDEAQLKIDGLVDVRYIREVSQKSGEERRLNIDAGPKRKLKLRFASASEGNHWKEQLELWKEHQDQLHRKPQRAV